MNEEQDRVVAVRSANIHDLPRTAERDLESFLHAVRCDDLADVGDDRAGGGVGVVGLGERGRGKGDKRQNGEVKSHGTSLRLPAEKKPLALSLSNGRPSQVIGNNGTPTGPAQTA